MKTIALSLLAMAAPFVGPVAAVAATQPSQATQGPVYADGTYTGPSVSAYYGNIQMGVTIKGGKVANFQLLDYPHHTGTSYRINQQALPMLASEVVTAQSANVDIVSGATLTSEAFIRSLGAAFQQASKAAGH
ncbi:MAG: FMN-binding protein [Devosia sp.]|nr:FMN-binding protein [Devosia sp.]